MNRRHFLFSIPAVLSAASLSNSHRFFDDEDALLCKKKFDLALSLSLQNKPIGEVVVEIGKTFLGTPYAANALEVPGEERLVVNMRGLDCVSFYENAIVLARCVKKNKMTFDDYKAELKLIRYRGGVINGYPSRLHYTSDYFYDNEKKGVWKNVTRELGGIRYRKVINFMSTHPESYRQLQENPQFLKAVQDQEKEISKREMFHIPKAKIEEYASGLNNGDIIGITTDIEGLDVSHTGVVIFQGKACHLLHAPNVGHKVSITEKPLAEYVAGNKRQIGVMVVRPLEPSA
jgi:hypothetical protein